MGEILSQAGSILGNLKNRALDTGTETGAQNQQIRKITEKADANKNVLTLPIQEPRNSLIARALLTLFTC